MESLKDKIITERLPQHIAIIMDGNGRWAKEQGKMRVFGHQHGVDTVRTITEACAEIGVKYLTLYAFSTENWNRSSFEVNALMKLLTSALKSELKTLNNNNVRLNAIGDLQRLPKSQYEALQYAMDNTKNNTRMTITLCLSYSSRWELTKAMKDIATEVQKGLIKPEDVDETMINSHLATAGMPDPDLLIRTSGEERISNYMLWQIAYSELYFTKKYWPDFSKEDLYEAVVDYQNRERRFGKTSEQIKK